MKERLTLVAGVAGIIILFGVILYVATHSGNMQ